MERPRSVMSKFGKTGFFLIGPLSVSRAAGARDVFLGIIPTETNHRSR